MNEFLNITGERYGRLVAIEPTMRRTVSGDLLPACTIAYGQRNN
jgi:hypothetical protein